MSNEQDKNHSELTNILMSMGFQRADCEIALIRAQGDMELAIDILSHEETGEDVDYEENDGEFDLIAEAEPLPYVQEPTVFYPRNESNAPDHFREGSTTVAEMVDSRIQSLVAMGFTAEAAESALKRCNNDVNEALNMLLSS